MNGTYHQTGDNRPESFRPRQDEMVHVEGLDTQKNWLPRRDKLGSLICETTNSVLGTFGPNADPDLVADAYRIATVPRAWFRLAVMRVWSVWRALPRLCNWQ